MKFSIESTASYNSIHPAYHYTEQFANNGETYRDGTKWYGVFLAFISGTFFTISSALVKAIRNVDPMILLVIRALMQILAMAVVACRSSSNLFGPSGQRILIHFQVKFARFEHDVPIICEDNTVSGFIKMSEFAKVFNFVTSLVLLAYLLS